MVWTSQPQSNWSLWTHDLRTTWLWVFLLCLAPFFLWGTAFFSMFFLMGALLIGVPVTVFGQWKNSSKNGWRRLAVMVSVPAATIALVFHLDEQTPINAAPIAKAIETFRTDAGHYPESLEMLMPKYLAEVPMLRLCVLQPGIWYGNIDGKPYLRIPSARGDQFANYEYDFATKAWLFNR